MARIGFIGSGEIATAMVKGLAGQGHQIVVSERNAAVSTGLAAEFADVTVATNQAVLDGTDIVWLCLMETVARSVLPKLSFRPDHIVISAMVGVGIEDLGAMCGEVREIAVTIPMPFIATGGCPLPVYPDCQALHDIFGARNFVLPVASEIALNAHFGASAMASALMIQMQEGMDWLAGISGDHDGSEKYVAALFAGYMGAMEKDGQGRFRDALDALNTEGSLNATLREHMIQTGSVDALRDGLDGFRGRLGLPDKGLS